MSGIRPATWNCRACLTSKDMPCILTADDEGLEPDVCPFFANRDAEWRRG